VKQGSIHDDSIHALTKHMSVVSDAINRHVERVLWAGRIGDIMPF